MESLYLHRAITDLVDSTCCCKRVPKIIPVICTYYFAERGLRLCISVIFTQAQHDLRREDAVITGEAAGTTGTHSAMWRTDWIPIPLPVRLDDWKISFFFRILPSKVFSTWIRSR